ncbi:MAG: sulfatase [Polyangia bacterium]
MTRGTVSLVFLSAALALPVAGCRDLPWLGDREPAPAPEAVAAVEDGSAADASAGTEPDAGDAGRAAAEEPAEPPNVLLVLLDTLRPDYLGFYGFEYETAPFLAELAEQGTVFHRARSASSWTAPATSSMFTSLYPPQHGVTQGFRAHKQQVEALKRKGEAKIPLNRIPRDRPTLPEMFQELGYATYGLASNINIGDSLGFSRGFDHFDLQVQAPAATLNGKLEKWKDEIISNQPFFVYLHLNDVHAPYTHRQEFWRPPGFHRGGDSAADYRSEIGYTDAQLRKAWEILEMDEGRNLLAAVSDHGEEFWDHDGAGHGPKLYRELTRVLMMFHGPELGIDRRRSLATTSLVDVYPTLVDFAGGEAEGCEGLSLAPILRGDEGAGDLKDRLASRVVFAHRVYSTVRGLALWAAMHGRWKLIDWWGDRNQLFDHVVDPREQEPVTSERPEMDEALAQRLERFKERMKSGEPASEEVEIELDEELLGKLETLGYADID